MKKLLILCCALVVAVACKEEPKDYVTLSGKITDKNSDSLVVRTRGFSKAIQVNEDGTFKDTLKVETGLYFLYDGSESTSVFLKNGFDLNVTIDTKAFDETVKYTGTGSEHSNFLAEKILGEPLELKQIVQVLFSNGQRIDSQNLKKFFDIEETTEEKKLASYKRGIRNELKKLRDEFPSFTKHMGDVAVKSSSGIIVKDDGFIYYPAGDIKWSLD